MKKIIICLVGFLSWYTHAQVGIGTTTPATRLHIENGNVMGTGEPSATTVPSLYIYNNNAASSTAHAIASLRTNGAGSGNPYISWDLTSVMGYSMGIDNSTDQLIITNNWNFNNASAEKKMMIFNPSAQSRVIIPNSGTGTFSNSWPSGWGGGLATYDLSVLGIYYNGMLAQSDQRLKNSIQDLDLSFVNKFMSLRPVNYYWNEGKSEDKNIQYGFIAQEVAQIFPELVFTGSDEMQTKSMNYQAFHAMSARMIQLQQAQLKEQQQEINELKRSLESLDARLQSLEKK
jgi:hypothetical protein